MTEYIPFEHLATVVFTLIDDWYQTKGVRLLSGKRGRKARFSDSELMTLLLLMDFLPFPGETQFLGFIRANYLHLFPELIGQSQFNRRTRGLRLIVEEFRRHLGKQLAVTERQGFLMDTKPIPVIGYKRSKSHSDFVATANYGVCASRNLKYFGYKLVMISTMDGIPVTYELVPASTDERTAADELLDQFFDRDIYADKGFIGTDWQNEHYELNGNRIWTSKRANQKIQNPKVFDLWLNSIRERIEGAFHELQNTGRNLERLLRKTVLGLTTHIIAKVTSHTLKLVLRRFHQIDVQTFKMAA